MNQPHGKGIASEKNHEGLKISRLIKNAARAYNQRGDQDKIRHSSASQQEADKNDHDRVQ